jgi:hypothetical protein
LYSLGRSYQTAQLERTALGKVEATSSRELSAIAAINKGQANSELEQLRAERQKIDAMLLAMPVNTGMRPGLFSPSIPQADESQVSKLREQRLAIHEQIAALQTSTTETEQATTAIEKLAQSEKDLTAERKESDDKIARLQALAVKRAEIEPQIAVAGAQAGLASEMITSAFLAPFRDMQVQMTPEQEQFQSALLAQITALEMLLTTIDVSTAKGQTEAAQTKTEISRLRNEQARQAQMAFQLAMSDGQDNLNILRLQYQVASTTPLGIIGSLK